ncbi:hypothetical protein BLNAU_12580 [Blattamonas nauphoetae]|uniref:Uncharacterized protein n=1 Tax=Blattamonas nauphoetae TaxID=2049346 RepID=A0ABQ9XL59_9EUKA|nr:hypothetical protein BLNAU_12580 [Blattamonas nauphoetae]
MKSTHPENHVFWFDSGDFSRGTCYSECESPAAEFVLEMMGASNLEATTIGEHDVRDDQASDQVHRYAGDLLKDRIVTTNVFIDVVGNHLGIPYRIVNLDESHNLLIFGFSAPFPGHPSRISYYSIETSLNSQTVTEGLRTPNVSLVVCLCHLAMKSGEVEQIEEFFSSRGFPAVILCGRTHQYRERFTNTTLLAEDGAFLQTFRVLDFSIHSDSPSVIVNPKMHWFDMKTDELMSALNLGPNQWETQTGQHIRTNMRDFEIRQGVSDLVGCPLSQYSSSFELASSLYTLLLDKVYPSRLLPSLFDNFPEGNKMIYLIENGTMRQPIGFKAVEKGDAIITDPYDRAFILMNTFTGDQLLNLSNAVIDWQENINFTAKYKLQNQKIKPEFNYSILALVIHPAETLHEFQQVLSESFTYTVTSNTSRAVMVEYLNTEMNCEKTQRSHIMWSAIILAVMIVVVLASFIFLLVWSGQQYFRARKILAQLDQKVHQEESK